MHNTLRCFSLLASLSIPLASLAAAQEQATPADSIRVPDGFQIELVYSVPKAQQGSWVSMTVDPKGRLITSDQSGGLYRVTPGSSSAQTGAEPTRVEALSVDIGEAHGLLWVDESLYVVVNGKAAQGSGLYRARDTDGDDQLDEVQLLKRLRGAGEHGPHAVRLGPDGMLYVIGGNHTRVPSGHEPNSPHRNWAEDQLLKRNPDGRGHATGVMAPGGWIARTDRDGQRWELICAGFRNPYDIDFNQDGELFTFDADMEWDTGTPWYRPTRINHVVSAAEFGWRFGTGKWPAYYPDSLGAVVDIGLGSPTGIVFGTGAAMPHKYQRALFICDWTYGKIYAVHMRAEGASYSGSFESFVEGKPLPVTDIVVNPVDRGLYFTVGGRGTQSGLYRVTYKGREATDPAPRVVDAPAEQARQLRRKLESFHGRQSPEALAAAWDHLSSTDRSIRYAARLAIEHQDVAAWQRRALEETRPMAAIHALLALTRVGSSDRDLQSRVIERLNQLPLERLTEQQLLDALRVYQLAMIRLGGAPQQPGTIVSRLMPLFASQSEPVNRELCRLLVYLQAPGTSEIAMRLLEAAQTQEDQLFYVFVVRTLRQGWTAEQRKAYFSWMNLAEKNYRGGASFPLFVGQVRADALETLSDAERAQFKDVIAGEQNVPSVRLETTRQFVHNWQLEDLVPMLDGVDAGRSYQRGKEAYEAAQCAKCHRFAGEGGSTGPDITGVGNRFTPLYLLESLIVPAKVVSDQYQQTVIATAGGEVITGRIIEQDPQVLRVRTDPFAERLTEVSREEIDELRPSSNSEMPAGLINVLSKEEILDLIAFLRSAGNPDDKAFRAE